MPTGSARPGRALRALACLAFALPAAVAAAPDDPVAPGVRTLYLVRHGAYDEADPRDAAVGKGLVPIGVAQAKALAARLRALPFGFDEILASPLTRARETAEVIAADLDGAGVEIVPDLAECTPPTRRRDITDREKPEDLAACSAQLERLAATLFAPSTRGDRHDLVVCHGNVTRWLVTRALAVAPDSWLGMSIGHASLTVIRVDAEGGLRVLAVGDVGHLPPSLQTGRLDDPDRTLEVLRPAPKASVAPRP